MKKNALLLVTILLLAAVLAGCAGQKKAELGAEVFKVTGDIGEKNSGDTYVFDEAGLEGVATEATYNDPWMGDGQKYKGVTLPKLLEAVKPGKDAKTVSLVCSDGKALDVPIEDAQKYDIMLVHWADGTVLDSKSGGPVKLAFPDDARTTYVDDQWMWWIVEVKVK